MATKSKKKTTVSKSKNLFFLKRKYNQTQAIAIIVIVVAIGVAIVLFAHAAASPVPATYYENSPGIAHTAGFYVGKEPVTLNGQAMTIANVWSWDNYNNAQPFQDNHFLQYGPYVSLSIPAGKTGLHVCYYYAAYNENNTTGYLAVYTDVNTSVPTFNPKTVLVSEDLQDRNGAHPIHSLCTNYAMSQPGAYQFNYQKVEYRLKVTGSSDGHGVFALWKTTVDYY